ncbi:hypothetical protein RRG08_020335 [Elysia crispata]|uniref:EF-hand domain-containing protein n=1 Tax=Elysia crispata TaxID=231223 RepID=A0AAE1AGC3_9GAST|nr:hypothetical protein RRG08_020335 [Elysia crispata]
MLETAPAKTTDEDTKKDISEEERKEIREAFEILDEDGDGKLSLDEMRTLLQSQFMTFTDAQANALLAELDTDKSGTIEYDEFEQYVIDNGLSKPTPEEFGSEMREAFEMFDTDNNGYIDAEEFKTFMMTLGDQMTEEQVSEMMKEVDTNGDGKIDYKEFCTHMMNSM